MHTLTHLNNTIGTIKRTKKDLPLGFVLSALHPHCLFRHDDARTSGVSVMCSECRGACVLCVRCTAGCDYNVCQKCFWKKAGMLKKPNIKTQRNGGNETKV